MNKIRQTLYQKQTQNLLLKPKMLQSLEMLAMPLMQLETHLKQEMITNPMLELLEPRQDGDDFDEQEDQTEPEESPAGSEDDVDFSEDNPELQKTLEETRELSEILDAYNEYYFESYQANAGEAINFEQIMRTRENRKSDYLEQLEKINFTPDEYDFAYELVDSCNEHGYLPKGFIIESLADEYGISVERSAEIHDIILHLEPPGITARDIRECLLVQLDDDDPQNEFPGKLIKDHFDDLIHKRYKKIASFFGVTTKIVLNWKDQISHLDPKPGLRIISNSDNYIVPDIILKKIGNEYEIIVNDFSFPRIRMSSHYKNILKQIHKDKEAVDYVRSKINSAKFLIKSVYLRSRTLVRVMRSIINNQPGFFYENTGVLNPLTYSVIAEELQVNESTISRVVRHKYADTPFGIMCLKDFFTSKAGKDDDYNAVSRHSVELQIKKMIDAEDEQNPISDQDIADSLKGDGITVSRRVVAKYRKFKGILNSHLRRKE